MAPRPTNMDVLNTMSPITMSSSLLKLMSLDAVKASEGKQPSRTLPCTSRNNSNVGGTGRPLSANSSNQLPEPTRPFSSSQLGPSKAKFPPYEGEEKLTLSSYLANFHIPGFKHRQEQRRQRRSASSIAHPPATRSSSFSGLPPQASDFPLMSSSVAHIRKTPMMPKSKLATLQSNVESSGSLHASDVDLPSAEERRNKSQTS